MKKTGLLILATYLIGGCGNSQPLKPQPTENPWKKAEADEKKRQLDARQPVVLEDVSKAGKPVGTRQLEAEVGAGQAIVVHLYNRDSKPVETQYPFIDFKQWHFVGKNLTTGTRAELSALWKKKFNDSLNESDYSRDFRGRSSRPMQVKPGKSEDYQFDLGQIFDLTVSGDYEFFVKNLIRIDRDVAWVVSQPIRIEVKDKGKSKNPMALALPNRGNLEYLPGAND